MKLFIKLNSFLLGILLLGITVNGQDIVFKHFTDKDGLDYSWIWNIFKDSEGYMWFSSREGAFRFDGYEFRSYNFKSSIGFSNVSVNTICEDLDSNIWFATDEGLIKYQRIFNKYKRYHLDTIGNESSNYINAITEDSKGYIWIATGYGLFSFDPIEELFKIYKAGNVGNSLKSNIINNLLLDSHGNLWIGDDQGILYQYIPHNEHFISYANKENLINAGISTLTEDHQGDIWIGYNGSGAAKFNSWSKEYVNNYKNHGYPDEIANNLVRGIIENKDHTIWFGTEKGLSILNTETNQFTHIISKVDNPNSLNDNAIYSLFKEENGDVWIGTFFGGINVYYNRPMFIKTYVPDGSTERISGKAIGPILKDEHYLWIGTEDKGLNRFDPKTETFRQYTQENTNLSYDNIHALCKDHLGNLWIGTYTGGLDLLPPGSDKFIHFTSQGNAESISSNSVYSICFDSNHNLWIGARGGLNRYDYLDGKFEHFYPEILGASFIWDMEEDKNGNIWICTYGQGIFELEKSKAYQPRSFDLPVIHPMTLFIRDNGDILIGTEKQGLIIYNPQSGTMNHLTIENGLPNNTVTGIIEDNNGNIWFTTNNGLCKTTNFKNIEVYTVNDGLLTNRFNYNSMVEHNGKLYFGSTRGLIAINPELQVYETSIPVLHLASITFHSGKYQNSNILESIDYIDKLKLDHKLNSFSIKYTGIDLRESNKIQYAIMMQGIDDKWSYVSNSRIANYNNLEPGEYKFSVKTVDQFGQLQDNEKNLTLTIIPPWWKTSLAKLIFLILLLSVISVIAYLIMVRIKTQHALEIEKLEKQKIKENNEAKIKFFTNISHEFKTPLTLINGPINELVSSNGIPESKRTWYYNLIKKNTERLLHLINELLEFRSITQDNLELKLERVNIKDFIENVTEGYFWIAETNNISFTIQNNESEVTICADSVKLEKILNNLLINAFSYTPKNGFISIETYVKNEFLYLHVRNSGKGLSQHSITKLFDRDSVKHDNYEFFKGTGIGLAYTRTLVELHKGIIKVYSLENVETSFIIKIPTNLDELIPSGHNDKNFSEICCNEDKIIPAVQLDKLTKKNKAKILLVEDVKELRDFISDSLMKDFEVLTASNGYDAFKIAQTENPNIVISDVMMPKMNGFELCQRLKNSFMTSHIMIILLTVLADDTDKISGYKSGADAYISKPFDMQLLIARIQNLLQENILRKKKFQYDLEMPSAEITYSDPDEQLLKMIIEIVNKNINEPEFDVNKFAMEIGLSKSTLYRKMKAITGLSINEFVQILRLKKAAILIKQSKMSIAEIAYSSGFNDPYYFSRSFKKNFRISPTEYRKSTL